MKKQMARSKDFFSKKKQKYAGKQDKTLEKLLEQAQTAGEKDHSKRAEG